MRYSFKVPIWHLEEWTRRRCQISANPNKLLKQHLDKFAAQYGEAKIVVKKDYHDRFVILDNKEVYVFGGSLKDLGNKCFGVFKSEDSEELLKRVSGIV